MPFSGKRASERSQANNSIGTVTAGEKSMRAVKPREMTEEQATEAVQCLTATCTLIELRRRQTLVEVQIRQAHRQQNTEALADLRAMEKHLQEAVARK
jgi:hypothetical protein